MLKTISLFAGVKSIPPVTIPESRSAVSKRQAGTHKLNRKIKTLGAFPQIDMEVITMLKQTRGLIVSICLCSAAGWAQHVDVRDSHNAPPARKLTVVTHAKAEDLAHNIVGYPQCDSDGNIYALTDYDARSAIDKFNPRATQLSLKPPPRPSPRAWCFSGTLPRPRAERC